MIARNTAGFLDQAIVPDDIEAPLNNVMRMINFLDMEPAYLSIRRIFTGGQVFLPNSAAQLQDISGIASYTEELPNFDSRESPADNAADTQGNLASVPVVSWRTVLAIQDTNAENSLSFVTTNTWVWENLKIPHIRHATIVWTRVEMK